MGLALRIVVRFKKRPLIPIGSPLGHSCCFSLYLMGIMLLHSQESDDSPVVMKKQKRKMALDLSALDSDEEDFDGNDFNVGHWWCDLRCCMCINIMQYILENV